MEVGRRRKAVLTSWRDLRWRRERIRAEIKMVMVASRVVLLWGKMK